MLEGVKISVVPVVEVRPSLIWLTRARSHAPSSESYLLHLNLETQEQWLTPGMSKEFDRGQARLIGWANDQPTAPGAPNS